MRALASRYEIVYGGSFTFALPPAELWAAIERFDRFPVWWRWLQHFSADGDGLSDGTVLRGVVAPPVPYRMRVAVELANCHAPTALDARVSGDLRGEASLRVEEADPGSVVTVAWNVEMMQRSMRLACLAAKPLLEWGHDRVVDMTVAGFRRRVEQAHVPPQERA